MTRMVKDDNDGCGLLMIKDVNCDASRDKSTCDKNTDKC